MRIRYKLIKAIVVVIIMMLGCACSTRRAATKTSNADVDGYVDNAALITGNWETFYAPVSIRTMQPMAMTVSGRATMVRNQYISISLRMLGFEVAVINIDNDSVTVADKYHKVVATESIESLTQRTTLSLSDIQDMLLGQKFTIPQNTEWARWGTVTCDDGFPESITIELYGHEPFSVEYSEYTATEVGSVAADVIITGKIEQRAIQAALTWNLKKAVWNEPAKDMPASFHGYRHISVAQIINQLRQM